MAPQPPPAPGSASDFSTQLKPHPDADGAAILSQERSRSTLPVQQLSTHLFGNPYLARQSRILKILTSSDDKKTSTFFSKTTQANLSRPDRYKLSLARGKRMRQLADIHNWDNDDLLMAEYLLDEPQPYHLHMSLFAAAMRDQTSDEQKAYWQPKIDSWEVVGAYAQTELGHGSNVRGIECEARWVPGKDGAEGCFELHSPTLTASKWWNGTLGRTATHAVVVAQLMLPKEGGMYESQGPRPFIVRIRDEKTHLPLEGVVVGDIGPKYGYAAMDNAYCLFSHHQIPHSALLSRYAFLDANTGAYTRPKNPASVYGSLTRGRSFIVLNARLVLMRATTIAVRYLSIRRQFRDRDASPEISIAAQADTPETAVLDYTTVQIRILPLLATCFALHYTGHAMWDLYNRTRSSHALDGDRAQLAELHSTSAGLKSLATELAANGIETCRRAMGGHGYGGGTGLVGLNADYLAKPTVEGDNWMITQQAARYLIARCEDVVAGKSSSAVSGSSVDVKLQHYNATSASPPNLTSLSSDTDIAAAFVWRTAFYAFRLHDLRNVQKQKWNTLLIDSHKLSTAYSQHLLVSNFLSALNSTSYPTPETKEVMRCLYRLYALHTIETHAREFQACSALSPALLDSIPRQILELMERIRPHAVRLVDSFALPDYLLDSALGREDGKVYEDLFHRAHVLNPLNRETFNPRWWEDEVVMGSGVGGEEFVASAKL